METVLDREVALKKLRIEKIKIFILVGGLFVLFLIAIFSSMSAHKKLTRLQSKVVDKGYATIVNGELIWKEDKTVANYRKGW